MEIKSSKDNDNKDLEKRVIEILPDRISNQTFDLSVKLIPVEEVLLLPDDAKAEKGNITVSLLTSDFEVLGEYQKTIEIFRYIPTAEIVFKLKLKKPKVLVLRKKKPAYLKLMFYFNGAPFTEKTLEFFPSANGSYILREFNKEK